MLSNMPPPKPCTVRPASKTGMTPARAHITVPNANTAMASRNVVLSPRRSITADDTADPRMDATTKRVVFQA